MTHLVIQTSRALARGATALAVLAGGAGAQQQDSTPDSTRHAHAVTLPTVHTVSAGQKTADAANAVVITPSAIRTVPANDAWDIVRQTAGIEVHLQGQGPGFASDAAIRGFTSDHSTDVAIAIDGVPLNETVSGHAEGYADWNAMMPEAVSSAEVTKGPASPWSGNFAMGGEVRIRTVPVTVGTQWSARIGSYGDARLSLLTGDAGAAGGWMLAADAQRASGWRDNSREAIGHLMASRLWQQDEDHAFTLAVSGYGGSWHSPGFITVAGFDSGNVKGAANPTDGGNEIFGTARAALKRPAWSGALESDLYASGGMWHIYLTIPPEGGIGEGVPSQTEELDQRISLGGMTRWSKQLGTTHLVAGVQYRAVSALYARYLTTDRVRDALYVFGEAPDTTPANLQATYVALSPVVEAHWNATASLSLGIGGRLDWMFYDTQLRTGGGYTSADRVVATPKLSALYRFTNALSAWASFNGGFRSSDGVIVTPALPPALENASEVGVRYDGAHVQGSAALFLIDVHNQQTVDPVTLQASASGTTRQQGVEVDGRVGLARWLALFVHATVNDAHYVHLVTDGGVDLAGVPVYQVAHTMFEGGFDVQRGAVAGSLWAAYTGAWTPVNEPTVRTAPYTLLNLRATFPLSGRWSGVVGIQNILDERYVEVRASGFVSPGTPRQFLLTVRHGV